MTTEEWRAIPGFPLYEASNLGRVRSLDRVVEHRSRWGMIQRKMPGRILSDFNLKGYRGVSLVADGKMRKAGVHQAVCLAWIGVPADGIVVNHIDGNKHNNHIENLEYITNSENVHHAHRTGLMAGVAEKISRFAKSRPRRNGRFAPAIAGETP
jgi:hypothetical protein